MKFLSALVIATVVSLIVVEGYSNVTRAEEPKPLIALIKAGGWVLYSGPDFVLYENGLVLFKRDKERLERLPPKFFSVNLNPQERDALVASLSITQDFLGLDSYYRIFEATDQLINSILLWKPIHKSVSVYGRIRKNGPPDILKDYYRPTPAPFQKLFWQLETFDHPQAREWVPETLDVRLFPLKVESWVENPIPWPAEWPDIDHPEVQKGEYGYYLSVPRSGMELLKAMFPEVGRERPVLIGKRQFKAQYWIHVPSEKLLLNAASNAWDKEN